jgi:hypothetical protein
LLRRWVQKNMTARLEKLGNKLSFLKLSKSAFLGVVLWGAVILLTLIMLLRASVLNYSPDSWSYVDIARSLFESGRLPGDILGSRDWTNRPWVNDSFPLLWPAIIAPGVAAWGPLAPVGAYAATAFWFATTVLLAFLGYSKRWNPAVAPLLGLALLALPGYVNEMHAGRSIPLAVLLTLGAVALALLARTSQRPSGYLALAGLLLGLSAANRFDALFHGPLILGLALLLGIASVKGFLLALTAWSVGPIAWTAYSVRRLQKHYATDNTTVATSTTPTTVTAYPLDNSLRPEDWLVPWLGKLGSNLPLAQESLEQAFGLSIILAILSIGITVGLISLRNFRGTHGTSRLGPHSIRDWFGLDCAFVFSAGTLLMLMQAILILTTGYGDTRYWATSGAVITLGIAVFGMGGTARRASSPTAIATLVFLTLVAGVAIPTAAVFYAIPSNPRPDDSALIECVSQATDDAVILPGLLAFRVPATSDIRASVEPSNSASLTRENWVEISRSFGVTHWVTTDPDFILPVSAKGVMRVVNCQ